MIRVYIAGPYTLGDVAVNVREMMIVADKLIDLGYAPFVPLYSHFQHLHNPKPYQVWTKLDNEWVLMCHCVLRIPGKSSGADEEVSLAERSSIPVFHTIEELLLAFPG